MNQLVWIDKPSLCSVPVSDSQRSSVGKFAGGWKKVHGSSRSTFLKKCSIWGPGWKSRKGLLSDFLLSPPEVLSKGLRKEDF